MTICLCQYANCYHRRPICPKVLSAHHSTHRKWRNFSQYRHT
ncbi:hypothetical protein [Moraxella marmotae]